MVPDESVSARLVPVSGGGGGGGGNGVNGGSGPVVVVVVGGTIIADNGALMLLVSVSSSFPNTSMRFFSVGVRFRGEVSGRKLLTTAGIVVFGDVGFAVIVVSGLEIVIAVVVAVGVVVVCTEYSVWFGDGLPTVWWWWKDCVCVVIVCVVV